MAANFGSKTAEMETKVRYSYTKIFTKYGSVKFQIVTSARKISNNNRSSTAAMYEKSTDFRHIHFT